MNTKRSFRQINHQILRTVSAEFIFLLIIAACLTVAAGIADAVTYYCDPVDGNTVTGDGSFEHPWGTLQSITSAGYFKTSNLKVRSGDTVKLITGFHGVASFYKTANHTDYITIEPNNGDFVTLSKVIVTYANYYHFKGLHVSPDYATPSLVTKHLSGDDPSIFYGYDTHHVTIEDCNIFTVDDASIWRADANKVNNDWTYLSWTGINIIQPYAVYRNNTIRNVHFGIKQGSSNSLVEGNKIDGFCEDGIRLGGPNSIYQDNVITNVYTNTAGWHNDGFQAGPKEDGNNIIIRRNYVCACTDPNRPDSTVGGLQGIFMEYPILTGLIENNVIMVKNGVHGISGGTARNLKILNNTVLRPYNKGYWPDISLVPDCNVIIRNNIADNFPKSNLEKNVLVDYNFDISNYNPNIEFVDYPHGNVHLAQNSHFIGAGSNLDAPNEDLEKNSRLQGRGYDIGAYEYTPIDLFFAPIGNKEVNEGAILTFTIDVNEPSIKPFIKEHNLPSEPNLINQLRSALQKFGILCYQP